MKRLHIIVRGTGDQCIEDVTYAISSVSGIDLKEKPQWYDLGSEGLWVWENVLWDVDSASIAQIKEALMSDFDISITDMHTTWWERHAEMAFLGMGAASVAGLAVGLYSLFTHPAS